jgi:hypothetical protein
LFRSCFENKHKKIMKAGGQFAVVSKINTKR